MSSIFRGIVIISTLLTIMAWVIPEINYLWLTEEERHLLKLYGDVYRDYMNRTPRWIGIPKQVKN